MIRPRAPWRVTAFAMLVCQLGCVTTGGASMRMSPSMAAPGDSLSDGLRALGQLFIGGIILVGVSAVTGVIVGIRAYILHARETVAREQREAGPCRFPVATVSVCQSPHGYRFALPQTCPAPSTRLAEVTLLCPDLRRPAYHACVGQDGSWRTLRSWHHCRSVQMTDAPGDFLPAGHDPSAPFREDESGPAQAFAQPATDAATTAAADASL